MSEQKYLGIDEIFPSNKDETEYAVVETKAGPVRIGSLSADEVIEWMETKATNADERRQRTAHLIMKSFVDGGGKRIGTEAHIPLIRKKGHAWTEQMLKGIVALNELNIGGVSPAKND